MNRYVIAGAVRDAESGKSVVLCCRQSRAHLDEVISHSEPSGVLKVSRANGLEHVAFRGGGRLALMNMGRDSLRGASADVVFLEHGASDRLADDALVAVAARSGEVVRA